MAAPAGLILDVGTASACGPKPRNEDALVVVEPTAQNGQSKGWLLALADGVSQSADGLLAAQSTVRTLAAEYYATPELWTPSHALERVLRAHNQWLGSRSVGAEPMVTTLSALVLRGRSYTLAHVGDCRIYRQRRPDGEPSLAQEFSCLTQDHVWQHEGYEHVLKRAMGLDKQLLLDFSQGQLQQGDYWVIASDGVWQPLGDVQLHKLLQQYESAQDLADALVRQALAAGGQDNASAVVVRVLQLPEQQSWHERADHGRSLAVPPVLKAGQSLAGCTIDAVLAQSRSSVVYRARDAQGQSVLLKALTELAAQDPALVDGLLAEAWLLRRAANPTLAELVDLPEHDWLLLALRFYEGQTLAELGQQSPRFAFGRLHQLALQASSALGRLHQMDVYHRDIKPENIHIDPQGQLRLLDLGVAYCAGITPEGVGTPGTPSYLAPELFSGAAASRQSDIYALGVSLYYLLTRRYPYGEIEPFQTPHFGQPVPLTRYRPDTPQWLERIVLKAVAAEPQQRFETCEELRLALELAEASPLPAYKGQPLLLRQSAQRRLQLALFFSLALNVLLCMALFLRA